VFLEIVLVATPLALPGVLTGWRVMAINSGKPVRKLTLPRRQRCGEPMPQV